METNNQIIKEAIVQIYTRINNKLQKPTFGILTKYKNKYWVITVHHSIFDNNKYFCNSVEIWSGVHPDVAKSYNKNTNSQLITKYFLPNDINSFIIDMDNDLIAFPISQTSLYAYNLDGYIDPIKIGDLAFIAFLDYADENNVLSKYLDGIIGNVSRINNDYAVISAKGSAGMSGSPVFKIINDKFYLFGIYTGTPQTTPVTMEAVINFSKVSFLNNVFIDKLK